ncbi:Teichuronic acid biosynthesis protein TuaB [subsurface metagenome]
MITSVHKNNDEPMNLKTKTIQGVGWSGISQIARLLIQFGITAILARLLTPNDFGLLAMVVVFTNFVMIFRDFGLTAALIQRKEIIEEHLSSCFWINILVGFLLTLVFVVLAPFISRFYSKVGLNRIIMILASTFFISSFGIVQGALFTKKMNFKPLAIIEISAVTISGAIAIVLAFSGFGVWSLVWQQIVSNLVRVFFLWIFSSWKPKFVFRWYRAKELLGFGLNLTGFNFVNYFNRNLDNLLIGRFLGSAPLGFYNLAYRLLLFPLNNISSVIGIVMFPGLSMIQDDKNKVCYIYIKATRYIAVITFPLMMGILVVAPQFIIVIFGLQWERSIFLVQILALVGLWQSIGSTVGWIYQSQGRTDILFKWGLFSVTIITIAFIIGLRWDVEGITIAYAFAAFLLMYPNFAIPFKLINLKVSFFVKQFKSIFLATIGMGGIVFILRYYMENTLGENDLFILIATVITGVISYAGLLFVLDKSLYHEVFQLLKQLILKPTSPGAIAQDNYN